VHPFCVQSASALLSSTPWGSRVDSSMILQHFSTQPRLSRAKKAIPTMPSTYHNPYVLRIRDCKTSNINPRPTSTVNSDWGVQQGGCRFVLPLEYVEGPGRFDEVGGRDGIRALIDSKACSRSLQVRYIGGKCSVLGSRSRPAHKERVGF